MTARRMTSVFAGFRFPREVISLAVRWYLRYGLSYRDVEELLAERGITADLCRSKIGFWLMTWYFPVLRRLARTR